MMKTYVAKPSRGNRLSTKAVTSITLALTAAFLSAAVTRAQTPVSTAEKVFNVLWSNGVANQKVQVYFPASTQVDGIFEITVTGNYHNTNTNGGIKKRIVINGRHFGLIQMQQSEVPFRLGNTGNSYTISNIMWDSANSRYYFVVANLDNAMNETTIHVKSITPSPGVPNANVLNASPIYTTDATVFPQLNRSFMGGNVGIGTESPDALLAVQKDQAGATAIRVVNNNTAGFSGLYLNGNPFVQPAGGFLQWNNNTGSNNLFLSTAAANPLHLGTNNSVRLTVLPTSGNVGIGTMTPAAKLDIAGGADNNGAGDQYDIALQYRLGGFRHRITSRHNSAAQAGNAIDFFVWKHGTDATTAIGTQHVMTLDGNGAVGIGNTAPAYKLDVAGSVRSSSGGFVFPDGTVQTTAASGSGSGSGPWSAPNAGGHINNTNTGNVGIGTSSPNQKLGVQGMLGLYPQAWVAPTGRGLFMLHTGTSGSIYAYNYPGASPDPLHLNGSSVSLSTYVNGNSIERITAAASGNVGVGTTNPTQKLHVFGGNVFHQFSSTVGQEWGFYTAINNNHVSSNLYFDGQWKMMTPGKGALISTAPLHGSAFSVIADNTARAANAPSALTTLMSVNMDGKVGIGTTAPAGKLNIMDGGGHLDIYTATGMSGQFIKDGLTVTANPDTGYSSMVIKSAHSTVSDRGLFRILRNDGASPQQEIMYARMDGNVGIGTAAPAYKLDVSGEINATGLRINGTPISVGSGGSSQWTTSGSNIFYNTGNVGVGTSSPAAGSMLDVRGNISLSGAVPAAHASTTYKSLWLQNNVAVMAEAASGYSIISLGSNLQRTSPGSWGFVDSTKPAWRLGLGSGPGHDQFSVTRSAPNAFNEISMFKIDATGNIGIGVGTAVPAAKLDVAGPATGAGPTIRASGGGDVVLASGGSLFFDGNYSYASGSYIRPVGANTQAFFTSGVERLRISSGGNVGIGTTNPAPEAKLQVQGNVSVIGDISATGNIAAKYQDVAEWVPSRQKLAAGTVVVLDTERSNHVMASSTAYDMRVAGVVSAAPGVILGEGGEGKVMVATTGRVRLRVDAARGPIRVGDLLVTSDVLGVAMKSEPLSLGGVAIHRPGTLIGKALEPLEKGTGEILVLLSLQ